MISYPLPFRMDPFPPLPFLPQVRLWYSNASLPSEFRQPASLENVIP